LGPCAATPNAGVSAPSVGHAHVKEKAKDKFLGHDRQSLKRVYKSGSQVEQERS
jgi:hypothetical protein